LTNAAGENHLTGRSYDTQNTTLSVYIEEDRDSERPRLFQSEFLQIDFSNAEQTRKPKNRYKGEFVVTRNVELTEIEEA
jgi:hypothetical protein